MKHHSRKQANGLAQVQRRGRGVAKPTTRKLVIRGSVPSATEPLSLGAGVGLFYDCEGTM